MGMFTPPSPTPAEGKPALVNPFTRIDQKPKSARKVKLPEPPEWHAMKEAIAELAGYGSVGSLTSTEHGEVGRWTNLVVKEAGVTDPAELRRRWEMDRAGNDLRTFASFITKRLTLREYLPGAPPPVKVPGRRTAVVPRCASSTRLAAEQRLFEIGLKPRGIAWVRICREAPPGTVWWDDPERFIRRWTEVSGEVPTAPFHEVPVLMAV